jgi:hypothetical protein
VKPSVIIILKYMDENIDLYFMLKEEI